MQQFIYFAGWSQCTAEDKAQKEAADNMALLLFIALCYIMFYLFRLVRKSKLHKNLKLALNILLVLLAIPICVGVPVIYGLLNSPWCT